MSEEPPSDPPLSRSGMAFAATCYLAWGLTPIYWKGVPDISPQEVLIPRVLWTLALLMVVVLATGQRAQLQGARAADWAWSLVAAGLLAANWMIFVHAVQTDQVMATSLGYYINPLASILLGLVILHERLSTLRGIAVGVAALGVAMLTAHEGQLPWISLLLAGTFALYGLIHKLRPQPPLGGLSREMIVLAPFALIAIVWLASTNRSSLLESSLQDQVYLSATGLVTAGPLLLFHAATKRLPLVAVGMFQYIAPTIALVLAITAFGEPFSRSHGFGFGLVWIGLLCFTYDSIRPHHPSSIPAPSRDG